MLRNLLLLLSILLFPSMLYAGQKVTGNLEVTGDVTVDSLTSGGTQCAALDSSGKIVGTGSACGSSASAGGNTPELQWNQSSALAGVPRTVGTTGGNIGIGTTTTPGSTLSVSTNSTTDPFRVSSSASVTGDRLIVKNGGNVGVGTINPGSLLDIFGSQRILNSGTLSVGYSSALTDIVGAFNGNVGIGDTDNVDPETGVAKLLVNSSSSTAQGLIVYSSVTSGSISPLQIKCNTVDSVCNSQTSYNIDSGARIRERTFGTTAAGSELGVADADSGEILFTGGSLYKIGTSDNVPMYLATSDTHRVTITGGGNVGIGSLSPGVKLDVQGTFRASTNIVDTALTASRPVISDASKNLASGSYQGNTTTFATTTGSFTSGNLLKSDANANFIDAGVNFGTLTDTKTCTYSSATTTISCTSSGGSSTPGGGLGAVAYNSPVGTFAGDETKFSFNGTNVGIGTTNGLAVLDVRGDAEFTGGNVGIGTNLMNGSALNVMGGPVGIGTWKPASTVKLAVIGNVGIGTWASGDTTGTHAKFEITGDGNTELMRANATGINDPAPPLILTSAGNVGIGTTTPGALLQVSALSGIGFRVNSNGNILSIGGTTAANLSSNSFALTSNGNATIANAASGSGAALVIRGGGNAGSHIDLQSTTATGSGDYVRVIVGTNGGTEAWRAITSGNIGIGSTAPGKTLDVQGSVRISTGTAGAATCWTTDKTLGHCTTVVDASGNCTCS